MTKNFFGHLAREGGGAKALMTRPLRKELFFVAASLRKLIKCVFLLKIESSERGGFKGRQNSGHIV